MKLSFCTKGSMRVLKICATSGPSGSAVTSTVFPSAVTAVRWTALGGRPQKTRASSSSFTPTPVLAEQQTMGISVPPATAWTISRASSSSLGSTPSK